MVVIVTENGVRSKVINFYLYKTIFYKNRKSNYLSWLVIDGKHTFIPERSEWGYPSNY